MMASIIFIELQKIFKKGRSFIGFGAITILIPIIQAAMYSEGNEYFSIFTQGLQQQFEFSGNFLNGFLIAYIALQSLLVHIPLLVSLVAGDMLAGEALAGTYRVLFTRPVTRTQIVIAKFIACQLYTLLLIVWMSLLSMGLSLLLFGKGELFIISSIITILPQDDIGWRFVLAYAFGILSMGTVSSIAFFFSSIFENAIAPIAITMAIIIVFTIISALDAGFIKDLKYYLFTNHIISWRLFFEEIIPLDRIQFSVIILLFHMIAAFWASIVIINKKDILT